MHSLESSLMARAAEHNGVFTDRWWHAAGLSDTTLSRRVADGHFIRLGHGVYCHASVPDTHPRRVTTAVLACHDLAAASHVTAAFLWGMVSFGGREPREIEVVTRRWRRNHQLAVVHESTDLIEGDVTTLAGVPITTPTRTLVDLGGSAKSLVGPALDHAIRKGLTDTGQLLQLLQRVARRGRNGVGVIRPHLAEHLMVSKITDSYLESLFFRGLGERGIPLPEPQFPVVRDDNGFVCRLDFAYPGVRVGIALDGMEFHTSRERFRIDRAQHNEAELLGWLVLRYTWWDVSGGMDRTVNQLRQALRLRGMAA